MAEDNKRLYIERGKYKSKKKFIFRQEDILELAVKVIVDPTYGWLTASLILYGCHPIETLSLIPSSDGKASVFNFNNNQLNNVRRTLLASPFDFVNKLNILDQISQPIFIEKFSDYDLNEANDVMEKWSVWFEKIYSDIELHDFRGYWAKRVISEGISIKLASKYMGITFEEFCLRYM